MFYDREKHKKPHSLSEDRCAVFAFMKFEFYHQTPYFVVETFTPTPIVEVTVQDFR